MGNRKVYWVIIIIPILYNSLNGQICKYYYPDAVIQSAFIDTSNYIEYSFPDLTTAYHFRFSSHYDSTYSLHFGLGYPILDFGISFLLFKKGLNRTRLRITTGTGIRGAFFVQGLLTTSMFKNSKHEYGFNFASGLNGYGMMDISINKLPLSKILRCYGEKLYLFYLKEEVYYIYYLRENIQFGFLLGISQGLNRFFGLSKYKLVEAVSFQVGISIKYRLSN